jgi:hypothetical protein
MNGLIPDTAVRLPAPQLCPFITQYAGFRASGLPSGVHFGLPSSSIDLIISLGHPIELIQMPNSMHRPSAFTALVSGLQDGPAIVRQESDAFGLHVFIKPLGVRAILGVVSAELSSLVLNLSDIWGNRAEGLVETLLDAGTAAAFRHTGPSVYVATQPNQTAARNLVVVGKIGEKPWVCPGATARG